MDRGAWWATVHGVPESPWLSDQEQQSTYDKCGRKSTEEEHGARSAADILKV